MKKIKLRHFTAAFLILIVCFLIICPIVNDATAASVANKIWNTSMPEDTVKVEKISKAGKLAGSGNGMQFFGAVLIQSDLSIEELNNFFDDYAVNEWTYVIKPQPQSDIEIIEHGNLSFNSKINSDKFYIIYSWGEGISPFDEFDLRGH